MSLIQLSIIYVINLHKRLQSDKGLKSLNDLGFDFFRINARKVALIAPMILPLVSDSSITLGRSSSIISTNFK